MKFNNKIRRILLLPKLPIFWLMGSFRSEPDLTKETYVMSSRDHSYAISHMCGKILFDVGWRKFMEDACLCVSPFTYKNYSLFGVFDGHGGMLFVRIRTGSSTFY